MGYEKRKTMGQKPNVTIKAEGEQKAPYKAPKMATAKKTVAKKMVAKKTMTKKKM
jgi:hypothetical protein